MKTIYIIPGNPGHPIFYQIFIKMLEAKTGYTVVINPLPGHTKETMYTKCTLRNIIRYHTKQIKKYKNVILIGHSIGCFIGLHVVKRVTNVDKFILLFPAIAHMTKTPRGEFINQVEPIYKFFAPLLNFFPNMLSNWITNSEHGHNIFHKQIMWNCLGLWEEEKSIVTTPPPITKDKQDHLLIYSTRDDWTPPFVIRILKRMFPNTIETRCDHAFVLNEIECKLVCKHITKFI